MAELEASKSADSRDCSDDSHARVQARAWAEHAYAQLMLFRSLSLREKILAIEGMAEVAARFAPRSNRRDR